MVLVEAGNQMLLMWGPSLLDITTLSHIILWIEILDYIALQYALLCWSFMQNINISIFLLQKYIYVFNT